jgi:hypothetical protein
MITPFSVLDTRLKDWKARKEWWITNYKIQSELGREQTISKTQFWETEGVSVFDPYLCELMYSWFSTEGNRVLDPFAGGSVRGIVAEEMGRKYDGIDISKSQIDANKLQSSKPNWMVGDSDSVLDGLDNDYYDFVFTCPPYYDLEIYTDEFGDISNMDVDGFDMKYESILRKSINKLKNNRFFVIVVSEVREPSITGKYSTGKYRGLVRKTIDICEKYGMGFYNDLILYNSQHQASKVSKVYFDRNRKIASVHQNVLVFVKGNPDIATIEIEGGNPICRVGNQTYLSFRHAAIDIDADKLVASEVERRCRSRKSVYKDWQIIGEETKPNIKYEVGGIPFEAPIQIAMLTGLSESECRNRIESNNPMYRHWKKANGWDISYDEMEEIWECGVELKKPVIECDGIKFYSTKEASTYFGISTERIRQKIKDNKFKNWNYLL